MCLVRNTIANLCPTVVYFNALDFSECRCGGREAVLTLSVKIYHNLKTTVKEGMSCLLLAAPLINIIIYISYFNDR